MELLLALLVGIAIGAFVAYWLLRPVLARWGDALLRGRLVEEEASVREDALRRSEAVLTGKISEQLAPIRVDFPFNPADARFLGSPIDFIVFDGYSDVRDGRANRLRSIVFVDVKTGGARLTPVERRVRACVEERRVRYVAIDLTRRASRA